MKWLAGIDLLPESAGVLQFAAWVHRTADAASKDDFVALCIIRESDFFTASEGALSRIVEGVSQALADEIAGSPAHDGFGRLEARVDGPIANVLAENAAAGQATLVVGRRANRDDRRLVRLGQTVRRILRRLPTPVLVVPPDMQVDDFGNGPVTVSVDATESSLGAIRYGQQLAAYLGRPLRLAHVLPALPDVGVGHLSPGRSRELRDEHYRRAEEAFASFVAGHGLEDVPRRTMPGPLIDAVLDIAALDESSVLVCGSRRLSLAERLLSASTGNELAALARVPVAIVPPDFGATT